MSGKGTGRPFRCSEANLGPRDLRGREEIRALWAPRVPQDLKGSWVRLAPWERLDRRAKPGHRGPKGTPDRRVPRETRDHKARLAMPAPPGRKATRVRLAQQDSLGRRGLKGIVAHRVPRETKDHKA